MEKKEPKEVILSDIYRNRQIIDRAEEVHIANEIRYNRFKPGHPAGFIEAFSNYYYDIAEDLKLFRKIGKTENKYLLGADIAKEGLEMLEAMTLSMQTRKWEKIFRK